MPRRPHVRCPPAPRLTLVSLPRNDRATRSSLVPLTRACDHVPGTVSHGPLRARNRRSRSSHKEWCLKRSEQVEVMSVERLAVRVGWTSQGSGVYTPILG